jgi:hypothetical protein
MKSKNLVFVSLLLMVLMSSCIGGYNYGGYNRYGYNNRRYAARPNVRIVARPIIIAPRYGHSSRSGANRRGYDSHHHGRR